MSLWNIFICTTVCTIWIHFTAAQATDVTLICPKSLQNGMTSVVKATFLTANVAKCDLGQVSKVVFKLTRTDGITNDICTLAYPACDSTVNGQGCKCVSNNATMYTYELNLAFDKATQSGGSLDLRPFGCFTFSGYPFTHTACDNLTETAGSATTESPRGHDFTLICPADGYFVDGQSYILMCKVNGNALDAERCLSLNRVRLELLDADNTPTLLADSSYPTCDTNWTANARCASKDPTTNVYVYEFQFTTDSATQQGKSLRCWSNCIPVGGHNATINLNATTCSLEIKDDVLIFLVFLVLLIFLPLPVPLPWLGYPIYVLICWVISKVISADSRRPGWHTHYMCGKKANYIYFSSCIVTSDERAVLIWSKSPVTGRFVCYGTENLDSSESVSPGVGASQAGNQNTKHSSEKEKTKHTGTDGSPRKLTHPAAPIELTTVRTSSPPQATYHGVNQASGTPFDDAQPAATTRLRPLPEPTGMTSVERNSTVETSNKHFKLPPIPKPN